MNVFLYKIYNEMIKTGIYGKFDIEANILENIMSVAELQLIGLCASRLDFKYPETNNLNLKTYSEVNSLMNDVDAVIAFSPMSELENVELLVKNSKHVFFEPSSKYSNKDIFKLLNIIDEANVKVQAGFHYRFNNTFLAARPFVKKPKFIQSNNFRKFDNDSRSCSVLMDMLINDVDIVLSVIKSNVKNVTANATTISFNDPDVINVRIEFMNGSVAQLTAGRIATDNSHIMNFYCDRDYTSIDLVRDKAWQIKKKDINNDVELFSENIGDLIVVPIPVKHNNPYYDEISSFAKSILYNKTPEVDIETLIKTYKVIDEVKNKIKIFV